MTQEERILQILAKANTELYALDLVVAGVVKRRHMYVVLGGMEDRGLITGREDSIYPHRRKYKIAEAGMAKLLPVAKIES